MKKLMVFALVSMLWASLVFPVVSPLARGQGAVAPWDCLKQLEQYNTATPNAIETGGFWEIVREMEEFGNQAILAVEDGLKSAQPNIRLACARVLYKIDRKPEGIAVFMDIIKSESGNKPGLVGAELLGNLIKSSPPERPVQKDLAEDIAKLLDDTINVYQRLSLSKLLYQVSAETRAIKELKAVLEQKDPDLRLAAAFALADIDQFDKARDVLANLSIDPTAAGRMARIFLRYRDMQESYQRQSDSKNPQSEVDYALLDEIIKIIKETYVDPNKAKDQKAILEAAAAGLVGSLDRFSSYQNADERRKAQESLNMRYGGIGAYVNLRDEYLTIERPMFGQPAHKAGLRPLDRITEVEGESTRGKEMEYLIGKLKGEPGSQVKIKVFRRGWTKERDFTLTRAIVNVKTARAEMLPGQLGYLSILTFGDNTAEETRQGINTLTKQGMKALVVDVRRNSGGFLKAVIEMLDRILDKGMVIVTTRDQKTQVSEYKTEYPDKIDVPIYVLVDELSASASEIFCGVLQDHKRATLIGNTTFGKGSVQHLFELKALDPHPALRLTVALYYLPSGRSIHKTNGVGGVEPDIKVTEPERDLAKDYEFNKLLDTGLLDKYLTDNYDANKKLFQSLADDDGLDSNRYPRFDELYQGLKTRLEKDEVRQALRLHLRRQVSYEREQEYLIDFQEDVILQRTVVEAAAKLGIDLVTVPLYKPFAHKFENKDKEVQSPSTQPGTMK